ncbi:MAG: hypothetical protein JWO07_478 [Candidatus Saccharibacteria bacterium]|nr:hypothetical protein [Candidatus Saccharibacteria bacterium]
MDAEHGLKFSVATGAGPERSIEKAMAFMKYAARQAFYDIAINVAGDNDEIMQLVGQAMANDTAVDGRAYVLLVDKYPGIMPRVYERESELVVDYANKQSLETHRALLARIRQEERD